MLDRLKAPGVCPGLFSCTTAPGSLRACWEEVLYLRAEAKKHPTSMGTEAGHLTAHFFRLTGVIVEFRGLIFWICTPRICQQLKNQQR